MDENTMLIGILILAVLAVGAWMLMRKRQSEHLQKSFGPEYERAVDEHGSQAKAEADLLARKKRVEKMHLVPLAPAQAARFSDEWRTLQSRFIDNPKGVLSQADQLVSELMRQRGYPMGDFDSQAADISVDHPAVVHHYRSARDIAMADKRGEADTEAMRQAVVHYRALFSELLEVEDPHDPVTESSRGGMLDSILDRKTATTRTDTTMEKHR